jgi:DNA polymerase III epsilon subunit-like protein
MSYLVFDTETTTFPSSKIAANHPDQAHIIQMAAIVLDEEFYEVSSFYALIKPAYWHTISEGAEKAHGISKEKCSKHGVFIEDALKIFKTFHDSATHVIAHNARFDKQLIDIENEVLTLDRMMWKPTVCTMECTTGICMLPSKYPTSKYKWPKLSEAYEFLFKEKFDKAHDALADVRATARIFKWLKINKKVA